jgi:hypothetical protein
MPRYPTFVITTAWSVFNHLFRRLARRVPRTLWLRYESCVAEPGRVVGQILETAGAGPAELGYLCGSRATLGVDHTVSGNPFRFKTGGVELRLDEQWQSEMPGWQRRMVEFLTGAQLRAYGYKPGGSPD